MEHKKTVEKRLLENQFLEIGICGLSVEPTPEILALAKEVLNNIHELEKESIEKRILTPYSERS